MSGIDPARVGVLNLMAALRESLDQAKADRQVVTVEAAGAVPDDVIEEAAAAFVLKVYGPGCDVRPSDIDEMRAALSVPSVAEVFARDAKVREIVDALPHGATDSRMVALAEDVLAAVRPGGEP